MSIVKLNCLLLKICSFITIGYGAFAVIISAVIGTPYNTFAGSSASRGIVSLLSIGLLVFGVFIALYGGLVLFLCCKAKRVYGKTAQQIRKYRILTGIACTLVAFSIIDNIIIEQMGALGIIYIIYSWIAIIINLFNTFSNRIWTNEEKGQTTIPPEHDNGNSAV